MYSQRSKSERQSDSAHSRLTIVSTGLVLLLLVLPAYAKYGGGSANIACDSSGNGNDAIFNSETQ